MARYQNVTCYNLFLTFLLFPLYRDVFDFDNWRPEGFK